MNRVLRRRLLEASALRRKMTPVIMRRGHITRAVIARRIVVLLLGALNEWTGKRVARCRARLDDGFVVLVTDGRRGETGQGKATVYGHR